MTANQIPYDQLDWLQIAIYFLALPIVALFGAAIGLLGRTRRGGILWSTNVGLLGGAVACVILAMGISTTGIQGSRWFYAYFEGQYRWMMLITTLLSTTACALTAGAAWRCLHQPRDKQPFNISISNVMLVQLFACISLGCFIALRLFMLESSGQLPVTQQIVRIHGWELGNSGKTIFLDSRSMSPAENEKALTLPILEEVAQISTMEYAYFNLDGAWNVDLTPLLTHPNLKTMVIAVQQPTNKQLAPIIKSKLQNLLLNGDTSHLDFSRFDGAENLQNFGLMGATSRAGIELLAHAPLKSFSIRDAQVYGTGQPVRAWPKSIENFAVVNTNLKPEDFQSLANHASLKNVNLFDIVMKEEELAFLLTLSDLKSAMLAVDANSETWYEPLANLKQTNLWLTLHSEGFTREDAARLVVFTQLQQLDLDRADHSDEIVQELCNIPSLEQLTITSPDLTEDALMKLAVLPKLRELHFPPHLKTPTILKKFIVKRNELKLDHVHLVPKPRTPKPTPKKAQKTKQSPISSTKN